MGSLLVLLVSQIFRAPLVSLTRLLRPPDVFLSCVAVGRQLDGGTLTVVVGSIFTLHQLSW